MAYKTPAALYKMVPVEEALETVLSEVNAPKDSFWCPAGICFNHVLDEDVVAPLDIPDKPVSIVDGFAVVAGDPAKELEICGESRAGHVDEKIVVERGKCCYVTTGAALPRGADAVVMIEDTKKVEDTKKIEVGANVLAMSAGENVRQTGSDMAEGECILRKGKLLDGADVAMLNSLGISRVHVFGKPVCAVMSTGDEVVDAGARERGRHQIFDANRPALKACAERHCSSVVDLGIAGDTEGRLETLVEEALEDKVDVLVTSGGVSMGDADLVKPILEKRGKVHFGKVLMKPGKPLTFATIERDCGQKMLVFGLPGNPVSSYVTFNLVVVPALRKLAGWQKPLLKRLSAITADEIKMDPKRPEYHRVILSLPKAEAFAYSDPGASEASALALVAKSTGFQRSSRLLSLRDANALVEVPKGSGSIPAGSRVSCLLLPVSNATF